MPERSSAPRWLWPALWASVIAAFWARCAHWRSTFTPGAVELLPADSHYYVRFARLQLERFPAFDAFDSYVNFPDGATILWPPLHTLSVSAALALGPASSPEASVAWVGVAWGTIGVLLLGALAWRLTGAAGAVTAAVLLALTPALVEVGALGNADHHVHEAVLIAAVTLAFGRALGTGDRRWSILAGALVGAGRLFTPMAFAALPVLAIAALLCVPRRGGAEVARAALQTGLTAAVLLAAGALLFGEPASLRYEGLTAFAPLLALGVLTFAAAAGKLWAPGGGSRRGAYATLAGSIALLAIVAPQAVRALAHLGRGDPLLEVVLESLPLWRDPRWAFELLGPVLLALPFVLYLGIRLWRQGEVEATPALVAAIALTLFAALQARFTVALAGALAALTAHAISKWGQAEFRSPWRRVLVAAFTVWLAASLLPKPVSPPPPDVRLVRPTLRWIRDNLPPASANPYSRERPRYAIAASHQLGHFINLWAERPAIASTFSQAVVHQQANRRAAAIFAAPDDEAAYTHAAQAGARYVLVTPSSVLLGFPDFDRQRSTLTHLLDHGGLRTQDKPATGHFRWVFDSAEQRLRESGGSYARLFEVVAGARLPLEAGWTAETQTALGAYQVSGRDGAEVSLAYPGLYTVEHEGAVRQEVVVTEEAVLTGARLSLSAAAD